MPSNFNFHRRRPIFPSFLPLIQQQYSNIISYTFYRHINFPLFLLPSVARSASSESDPELPESLSTDSSRSRVYDVDISRHSILHLSWHTYLVFIATSTPRRQSTSYEVLRNRSKNSLGNSLYTASQHEVYKSRTVSFFHSTNSRFKSHLGIA